MSGVSEEWERRGDNHEVIRTRHAETGKAIVAVASIMVFVFEAS